MDNRARNIAKHDDNPCAHLGASADGFGQTTNLDTVNRSFSDDTLLSSGEVLELEDLAILEGEILIRVPRAGAEAPQATITLEAFASGEVARSVNLIRERQVILLGALASLQISLVSITLDVIRACKCHSLCFLILGIKILVAILTRFKLDLLHFLRLVVLKVG